MESYSEPTTPSSTSHAGFMPVLLTGLATTALTLFGLWFLNQNTDDFNIMGWYYLYIVPVGAFMVGFVAGSGYGIVSWKTGVRIVRQLFWIVLSLQILAYFLAQYIEYRHLLSLPGMSESEMDFFSYFDLSTRQIAFANKDGTAGTPLEGWGYAIRVLEILGFAGGGLLVLLLVRAKPYCESCQLYLHSKGLGLIPAGVLPKKIKKGRTEELAAYEKEKEKSNEEALQILQQLQETARAGELDRFKEILAKHREHQKAYNKLTSRVSLSLSTCPKCASGFLKATRLSGQGNTTVREEMGNTPVHPSFGHNAFDQRT
jgi:hypothetical protein